jgi:hypothetical protein
MYRITVRKEEEKKESEGEGERIDFRKNKNTK